jgi:hypothetical protein
MKLQRAWVLTSSVPSSLATSRYTVLFKALSRAGAIVDTGVTEREVEMDDANENTTVTESKEDTVMLGTVKVLEQGEIRHEDLASNIKQNGEDDEQERVEVHKEEKPKVALLTEQSEIMFEGGMSGWYGYFKFVSSWSLLTS